MKGLSLTLTIVIIAIVLLVTALVIMTIFGSQMAKIMNILTPWVDTSLKENDCRNRCASWCLSHPSTASTAWGAGDANPLLLDSGLARLTSLAARYLL